MSADLLPVHGSIDVPGQTDRYTFNLTDAKEIYFDSQTPHSSAINWSLTGPRGAEVTNRSFESSDASDLGGAAALSLVPGDYVLSVTGQGATTGAYDFHLLDLANAAPVTTGQQVTGQLNPGDETDLYKFNAAAGDTVFFDSHALNTQSTTWRVIDPEGAVVYNPAVLGQDTGPATLTRDGTYTVMIEGNVDQTAVVNYSFAVFPVVTTKAPITLGQTVAGNVGTPGHVNEYDFTVAQPTTVPFDSLTNRNDIQWTLTGGQGDLVTNRSFSGSDGSNISGDEGVSLRAGSPPHRQRRRWRDRSLWVPDSRPVGRHGIAAP